MTLRKALLILSELNFPGTPRRQGETINNGTNNEIDYSGRFSLSVRIKHTNYGVTIVFYLCPNPALTPQSAALVIKGCSLEKY